MRLNTTRCDAFDTNAVKSCGLGAVLMRGVLIVYDADVVGTECVCASATPYIAM